MINVPTVIILGAGASAEYGFPVGRAFKNRITDLGGLFPCDLRDLGLQAEGFEFIERFRRSRIPSPDRFLEENPDFTEAGKYCIAKVLTDCEQDRLVFSNRTHQPWYEILVHALEPDNRNYRNNRLTIVTFNYDRSLEYYLWRSFNADYSDTRRIKRLWDKKPEIIHLHGKLGEFDPVSGKGREYGVPDSTNGLSDELTIAADGIKIIHEVDPDTVEFARAEECLRDAERIIFLGFGFDAINLARLRVFGESLEGVTVEGTRRNIDGRFWGDIVDNRFNGHINARAFDDIGIPAFLNRVGL